jgi:uncharacterized membrane protein YeaQ/YmgE (transglycosylase-associated protein family)
MDLVINIVVWLVFGLVIGAIAKAIMPGTDGGSFGITALLGIVGAMIGGFIGRVLGIGGAIDPTSVSVTTLLTSVSFWVSLALAVVGALIVLTIYRLITGRSLKE